jgi:hypothetical protein
MDTIVIQPSDDKELELIKSFINNYHLKSRTLTEEDKEDFALLKLMEETDYNDVADTDGFIKSLRS